MSLKTNLPTLLSGRHRTHGSFKNTAQIAQDIKDLLDNHGARECTAIQREAMDHMATKIARILSGKADHLEHWVDLAGYSMLGSGEAT